MYDLTDILERFISLRRAWVKTPDAMQGYAFVRYPLPAGPTENWLILEFDNLEVPKPLAVTIVPLGFWTYVAAWDSDTPELTFRRCPTGNTGLLESNVAEAVLEVIGR